MHFREQDSFPNHWYLDWSRSDLYFLFLGTRGFTNHHDARRYYLGKNWGDTLLTNSPNSFPEATFPLGEGTILEMEACVSSSGAVRTYFSRANSSITHKPDPNLILRSKSRCRFKLHSYMWIGKLNNITKGRHKAPRCLWNMWGGRVTMSQETES